MKYLFFYVIYWVAYKDTFCETTFPWLVYVTNFWIQSTLWEWRITTNFDYYSVFLPIVNKCRKSKGEQKVTCVCGQPASFGTLSGQVCVLWECDHKIQANFWKVCLSKVVFKINQLWKRLKLARFQASAVL